MARKVSSPKSSKAKKVEVVLFRNEKGPAPRLFSKKILLHSIPAIRIEKLKIKKPTESYDWMILTSKNALQNLQKVKAKKILAIGEETYRSLPHSLQKKAIILKSRDSNSKGLAQFFKKIKIQQKILFPRSKIADPEVIQNLKSFGHRVRVIHTYTTRILKIRKALQKILKQRRISVFWITSPSVFNALLLALGKSELKKLKIPLLAIGPTTAGAIRRHFLKPKVSKRPSLEAMADWSLRALLKL